MKMKPQIVVTTALFFSMMLNGSVMARQLDQYEQQVEKQLEGAIKAAKGDGYQLLFPRNVGKLKQRSETFRTVLLDPKREYIFIAVCDKNCNELNFIVKDTEGNKVISDATDTPISVIKFKPPKEDRYQLTVRMEKCSAASCNYGMGVFSKR
ncbi:MAG: hypothetical protein WBG73_17190 [Coleofasciculaceae cyanobacterium]